MFKQLKSDIASKKFFALKRLGKNFAARSMMAFVVLIPLLVPLATCATRSQTANTTPGADVPNIAAVAAAETPKPSGADPYNPPADAPETSSDRGFNTEDFLHPDDGSKPKLKKAVVTFAPVDGPRHSNDYNVVVRINVPQNTDPVDRFVAYPYPMPLPIPRRPPNTKGAAKGNSAPAAAPAPGAAGAAAAPAPAAPESTISEASFCRLVIPTDKGETWRIRRADGAGKWLTAMLCKDAIDQSPTTSAKCTASSTQWSPSAKKSARSSTNSKKTDKDGIKLLLKSIKSIVPNVNTNQSKRGIFQSSSICREPSEGFGLQQN
jgi:hypothetical protein